MTNFKQLAEKLAKKKAKEAATKTTSSQKQYTYKKEVPVSTKTAAGINANKIKQIDNKLNGKVQRGYDFIRTVNDTSGTAGVFFWAPQTPLLFTMNDFYTTKAGSSGGSGTVYYPYSTGAFGSITTAPRIVGRWTPYKPGAQSGLADQYHQWKDQSLNAPSLNGYQPLYTDYRFCVNRLRCTPAQGDMWIRLDMIKPKRTFIPTTSIVDPKIYNLPTALGALGNMAVAHNLTYRNSFNPALWHHVQKTRWIKLKAVTAPSQNIMTNFHVRTGFNKKFLKLNNNVVNNVAEEFWSLLPQNEVIWLLVSISNNPVDGDNTIPDITVTRKTVWRDQKGTEQ